LTVFCCVDIVDIGRRWWRGWWWWSA